MTKISDAAPHSAKHPQHKSQQKHDGKSHQEKLAQAEAY
jgi:hypothetical protein